MDEGGFSLGYMDSAAHGVEKTSRRGGWFSRMGKKKAGKKLIDISPQLSIEKNYLIYVLAFKLAQFIFEFFKHNKWFTQFVRN